MLKSIEGVFRNGKVELLEPPPEMEDVRVVVTFMPVEESNSNILRDHGISPEQALDLRMRLKTFAQDWDSPEMDIYDED